MDSVPLRQRVLEVIADLADGSHRYGSGLLLGGRWMLTAAHVVEDALAVAVRGPDKVLLGTELDGALVGDQARLDLALLKVPEAEAMPHVPVAAVNRDVATGRLVEACWSVGYPSFQETERERGRVVRTTVQVEGKIPVLSGLGEETPLMSLHVTHSPRELPAKETALGASPWAGMSGAAVFAEGDWLVGLVSEHLPRRGPSDITVTPLGLLADPATAPADARVWWERMGVQDSSHLRLLPTPRAAWEDPSAPVRYQIEALVAYYREAFAGRDSNLKALDAFLEDPGHGYAFLHEPTGTGKTALLVHWVERVRARPEWGVVFAPVSRRYNTAEDVAVLGTLAFQLAAFHGESLELGDLSPERLRPLIGDYLRREPPQGRRLVVIIDGLDEAVGRLITAGLFPAVPPRRVKVVASAREVADRTRQSWLSELGWAPAAVDRLPVLAALAETDVATVLQQLGGATATLAKDPKAVAAIFKVGQGDPLTTRVLADDLATGAMTIDKLVGRAPGLKEYFAAALAEIVKSADSEAVYALLGLCSVAFGPLTHDDLATLAPNELGRRNRRLHALGKVERYLIGDGSQSAGYVLGHPRLRELYVEELLDQTERDEFTSRFVDYGRAWWQDLPRPPSEYLRRFWIAHLAAAGQWGLARMVLTDISIDDGARRQLWADAHYRAQGSYAGYLADLDVLWRHAEQEDDFATVFRCGFVTATTHSLGDNFPPQLLVALVTIGTPQGRWSLPAALEHIGQIPDPGRQLDALTRLLNATAQQAPWPWLQAIATAQGIIDEVCRAQALAALVPYLPDESQAEVLVQVLETAWTITDGHFRAQALRALTAHLPAELMAEALEIARAITDEYSRAEVLVAAAPHLPTELMLEALEIARGIGDVHSRAEALTALAPHLPPATQTETLVQALDAARSIGEDNIRALALAALVPYLHPEMQAEVLGQALETAQHATFEYFQAQALAALVPHLPPAAQTDVLAQALETTRDIAHGFSPAQVLAALAPQLPAELMAKALETARSVTYDFLPEALAALAPYLPTELIPQALEIARDIPIEYFRSQALAGLAPYLPAESQTEVLAEALEIVRGIANVDLRSHALAALAPHLPAELMAEAVEIAGGIAWKHSRAETLAALAPYLPAESQTEVLAEALEIVRDIANVYLWSHPLSALAPHLPAELMAEAVEIAGGIAWGHSRAEALSALAPHLPAELMAEAVEIAEALSALAPHLPAELMPPALEIAQAIEDDDFRARALAALVPYLPAESQAGVLAQTLEIVGIISNEDSQAQTLAALAPHLPAELMAEALEIARGISNEDSRAHALAALAPHLLPEVEAEVLAKALETARAIADDDFRARALVPLVPYLLPEMQTEVLAEILDTSRAIADEYVRARSLAALVPYLSIELLPQALEMARGIAWGYDRAGTLAALAPTLMGASTASPLTRTLMCTEWHRTMRSVARHPQQDFLSAVAALAPWTAALIEPQALTDISRYIIALPDAVW